MKKNRTDKVIGMVLIAAMISMVTAGCGGAWNAGKGDSKAEHADGEDTGKLSPNQGTVTGASGQGDTGEETGIAPGGDEKAWAVPAQESGNGMYAYPAEEYSSTADMATDNSYGTYGYGNYGYGNYGYGNYSYDDYLDEYGYGNSEEYNEIEESGFLSAAEQPLSTFSADVDTASYSNVRRMIQDGYSFSQIPKDAVKIEEMLNYFSYDFDGPKGGEPFGVNTEIAVCPWNQDSYLMMVGLQTEAVDFSDAAPSNLVFLIDVSGSMYESDKLPLLQQSFAMLAENLTSKDRVSIVTYAGEDRVVFQGVRGNETRTIVEALNALEASGSTNGSAGIVTAYDLAEEYFIKGGNNRVILATDGDLNVGLTTQEQLEDLISSEKQSGVFLSVLGFGTGNIKDCNMETLADKGNGNYAYIDSLTEAKKVLVEELGATLVTVAKDVKLQMEFDPAVVSEYRLIGYENRALADEDFTDDTKDAGEIGNGHSVTVLYEVRLTDGDRAVNGGDAADGDRASGSSGTLTKAAQSRRVNSSKAWCTLHIRYKAPDAEESSQLDYRIGGAELTDTPSEDFRFASAVAEFGMLLRGSEYAGDATLSGILRTLTQLDIAEDEYKTELMELLQQFVVGID